MQVDKRLLQFLKNTPGSFLFSILLGLGVAGFTIWQAWLLSRIIDAVFLKHHYREMVVPALLLFAGISLLRAVFTWGQKNAANKVSSHVKSTLRNKLSRHLVYLGPPFVRSERSGEISNTLLTGVDSLDAYFSEYLPQLFLSALIPLLILFFVFPLDLLSGFVFLFTAPIIPVFMILIGNLAQSLTQKQWKTLSRMSAHFLDVLQGLTTLKILGRSRDQIKVIAQISDDFRQTTMKVLRVAFLSALVLEIVGTISTAIVAVEIGLRLLYGKIEFQQALFILILAPEFYLPMRLLGTKYHAGMEGVAAARRIFEILGTSPLIRQSQSRPSLDLRTQAIRFHQVEFRYPGAARPALQNIQLTISPGEKIAVIGSSGAGKTTLAQLLLRFLDPTRGEIRVDLHCLRDIDPDFWRQQIAWVPQNAYLFHTTILENIRLANPTASEEAVMMAAQQARIHEFISSLPDGYQTRVGEKGARLSGGQAQRIALARAFLKDAPFLILDEPTSNLDPETEQLIQESMNELMHGRTVLLIAHRLGTVQDADQIVVLSEGKIRQVGKNEELLQEEGLYRKLLEAYGGMQ